MQGLSQRVARPLVRQLGPEHRQQLVTPVEPPGRRDGEVNQQREALRLREHRTYFRVRVVPEVDLAEHGQSKHAALAAVEGRETAR